MTTREEWLKHAISLSVPMFEAAGYAVPHNVRASVGIPRGRKAVGECWSPDCSADKGREIFISPKLTDPMVVLATLVHELCHACLPHSVGHKAAFVKLARAMHLEGKPTATFGGEAFRDAWADASDILGEYPQPAFNFEVARKKQGTRLIKCECEDCGFIFRTTQRWLDETAMLICPAGCGPNLKVG